MRKPLWFLSMLLLGFFLLTPGVAEAGDCEYCGPQIGNLYLFICTPETPGSETGGHCTTHMDAAWPPKVECQVDAPMCDPIYGPRDCSWWDPWCGYGGGGGPCDLWNEPIGCIPPLY